METTTSNKENSEDNKEEQDKLKLAFEALKNYKNSPPKEDSKYKELLENLKKKQK